MKEENTLRAVFVIAHPDDEHMPFGLPAELSAKGYDVHLIALTKGDLGSHKGMSRRQVARTRKKEFMRSAEILGVKAEILGMRDGELDSNSKKARMRLLTSLRLIKPTMVFIQNKDDYHTDHVAAYDIGKWAAYHLPDGPLKTQRGIFRKRVPHITNPVSLYMLDTQGSNTWQSTSEDTGTNNDHLSPANMILPLSDGSIEKSMEAFSAHKSQLGPRAKGQLSYPELAKAGAARRNEQAGFRNNRYAVGVNFIPFGGYAFSTKNILQYLFVSSL